MEPSPFLRISKDRKFCGKSRSDAVSTTQKPRSGWPGSGDFTGVMVLR
jgi:hypothetical protein